MSQGPEPVADRRRPLTSEEHDRVARALGREERVVASAPLLGGLDWGTYEIELAGPGGDRSLVVRRFDDPERGTGAADRLWTALAALGGTGLPVPEPVLRDGGEVLGAPVIVMTRVPGTMRVPPADPDGWIEEYAETAFRIHSTDLDRLAGPLPMCTDRRAVLRPFLARPAGGDARAEWDRIAALLEERADNVSDVAARLRHRDLWFGNLLWTGDRVTGIVDWSGACVGDARGDVAYARLDVQLVLGAEHATSFQRAYERRYGEPLDLSWWELLAALDGLAWLPDWVSGYREVGLSSISVSLASERLREFIDHATAPLGRRRWS